MKIVWNEPTLTSPPRRPLAQALHLVRPSPLFPLLFHFRPPPSPESPGSLTSLALTQRCHPFGPHRVGQRLQPVDRALGAQVARAASRGASRVSLPKHPDQELFLG